MQGSIWRAVSFAQTTEAVGAASARALLDQAALGFAQSPVAMTLADPHRPDCPVTHVNDAFTRMTGYAAAECVGRNCRFLQGPRTDAETVERIGEAVREGRDAQFELLNYRRDGTPFWNGLRLAPVRDERGQTVAICSTQIDVSELRMAREAEAHADMRAREVGHRIKNAFQAIESMVKLSARGAQVPRLVDKIATRVRAISNANATALAQPYHSAVSIVPVVADVLDPYQGPGHARRVRMHGPRVNVFPGTVSVLALVLNELAVNATHHGALSVPHGTVDLSWSLDGADFHEATEVTFEWRETGGPVTCAPLRTGEGIATIDTLLAAAGGRIARSWCPEGLVARVVLPRER